MVEDLPCLVFADQKYVDLVFQILVLKIVQFDLSELLLDTLSKAKVSLGKLMVLFLQ